MFRNMLNSDTGIDTIFNVSIHHVSQFITIIGCVDFNNMTYTHRLLSWHCNRIGFEKKVGLFC